MFFLKKNKEEKVIDEKTKPKDNIFIKCKALEKQGRRKEAIEILEEYISKEKKLGRHFSLLMEFYNNDLRIARQKGNEEEIKTLLDKIDALMKKSKDIVRGR